MPLIERRKLSEASELAVWDVTEAESALLKNYSLSHEEALLLATFTHPYRRTQWLATRILLNELVPGARITYDANGKPWTEKREKHISLSHSGTYIVLMTDDVPCGVDIETVRPKIERIAHKFLCEEELEAARQEPAALRMHIYWCVKEAIYKVFGQKNVSLRSDIFAGKISDMPSGAVEALLRKDGNELRCQVNYEEFRECMLAYTHLPSPTG